MDTQTETIKATFHIPEVNLYRLNQKIEQMNRKARKLGMAEVQTQIVHSYVSTWKDKLTGNNYIMPYVELQFEGQRPKIPGWTFLGTLEHTEAGNILRSIPGETIPETFRNVKAGCDHCKLSRNRKDTFVVRHESGEIKQVGRRCTRDYLGGVSPEHLGFIAEMIQAFENSTEPDEDGFSGSSGKFTVGKESFLLVVAELALRYGYVSRSSAQNSDKSSTASLAWDYFTASKERRRKLPDVTPTEEGAKLVKQALSWIQGLADQSDFMRNLQVMSQKDRFQYRDTGLASFIIEGYRRELQKIQAKQAKLNQIREEGKASQFVGEVKKRQDFILTLNRVINLPGYNHNPDENRYLYCFQDAHGNQLVWFASKKADAFNPMTLDDGTQYPKRSEIEVGKTYKVRATTKDHREYQGVKQTVLTRCDLEVKK